MSRVVVSEFISLDGVTEEPGWTFQFDRGSEGNTFKLDELRAADALLLGRVTYEGFAQAWPSVTDEFGYADKMNSIRKYVVSASLTEAAATWKNTTIIRGEAAAEIARLKAQADGDLLVFGSRQLAQALIARGLVDEYRLMVFPVILGSGNRLFGKLGEAAKLTLAGISTAESGIVMLTYRPASPSPADSVPVSDEGDHR